MKLLSQEMVDEMLKRAEEPEVQAKFKGLTIRLILVGTDCPENEDRQVALTIADGKFGDVQVEVQPTPGDMRTVPFDKTKYDAKITMPYAPLCDLIQEKMSMVEALPHVKIEGDLPKLMTQVEGFIALLQFIGSLPIEY